MIPIQAFIDGLNVATLMHIKPLFDYVGEESMISEPSILGRLAVLIANLRPGSLRLANWCGLVARAIGDSNSLRTLSRNCLLHLSNSPDELLRQLKGRVPRPPQPKLSDHVLLEALGKLKQLLDKDAIEPFLIFGSLLGPIRDGRFIPGDGDLDLGILGKKEFQRALDLIQKSSDFKVRRIRRFEREPVKAEVHCKNGVKLDFKRFLIEELGGTSWYTNNVGIVLKKTYPHTLKIGKIEFLGHKVAVPEESEDFLEWQYGDWKTPDSYYSMITSGPIHGMAHRDFVIASGPFAIIRAILHNRRPQSFHAQVRSMARLFPDDELWPALDVALLDAFKRLCIEPPPQPSNNVAC